MIPKYNLIGLSGASAEVFKKTLALLTKTAEEIESNMEDFWKEHLTDYYYVQVLITKMNEDAAKETNLKETYRVKRFNTLNSTLVALIEQYDPKGGPILEDYRLEVERVKDGNG